MFSARAEQLCIYLTAILSQYSELDGSTIYSDCWRAYDGLVGFGAKAHYRVKHSKIKANLARIRALNRCGSRSSHYPIYAV